MNGVSDEYMIAPFINDHRLRSADNSVFLQNCVIIMIAVKKYFPFTKLQYIIRCHSAFSNYYLYYSHSLVCTSLNSFSSAFKVLFVVSIALLCFCTLMKDHVHAGTCIIPDKHISMIEFAVQCACTILARNTS